MKKYSRELLIFLLKEYAAKNGCPPSKKNLKNIENMPSEMAFRKEFGSWGNALLACGFEIPKPYPSENCKKAVSKAKKGKFKEMSGHWKGGRYINGGYVYIWNSKKQKYEREHRVVMSKYLGRELSKNEIVHHKNKCKTDNRIENLELMTNSNHIRLHESDGDLNHSVNMTKKCIFPNCNNFTSSQYCLCNKHYKLQWRRLRDGLINSITDVVNIERKHTEETKKILSEKAKNQKRKSGRFSSTKQTPMLVSCKCEVIGNIYDNRELLEK